MSFDKPKVTIDLEEYQSLKELEREKNTNPDKWGIAAKKILWFCMLSLDRGASVVNVRESLSQNGIYYSANSANATFNSWESLSIKLEENK